MAAEIEVKIRVTVTGSVSRTQSVHEITDYVVVSTSKDVPDAVRTMLSRSRVVVADGVNHTYSNA